MTGKIKFEFTANMWVYPGKGGWHFISLPKGLTKEIRDNLKSEEEGWGRMKAEANIGNTTWETAIWFDTKLNTYILPVKAEIRRKEQLLATSDIRVIIWI